MESLGNLCQFLNGGTPAKSEAHFFEGEIPWITSADITGPVAMNARSFITEQAIAASATNKVPAGSVLLVTRTGVGKVAIAAVDLCFSQDITALIPDHVRVDTAYLVHFLRTKQDYFLSMARGATIKGITRDVVAKLELPLPSLAEQRRIAAILDKADALRAKRREALAQLDRLAQSIFVEMFGDQRPNSVGSDSVTLSDVIAINPRISQEERQMLLDTEVAFLPMAAISDTERRVIANELRPYDEVAKGYTPFQRGDLLVAKITPCYENGKMAITSELPTEHGFGSTEFHVFRAPTAQLGLFCFYLLGQDWVAEVGAQSMKGAAGQKRVPADFFGSIRVKSPQTELLDKFAASISNIEGMKKSARLSLLGADDLFASLQHRAFRGEL